MELVGHPVRGGGTLHLQHLHLRPVPPVEEVLGEAGELGRPGLLGLLCDEGALPLLPVEQAFRDEGGQRLAHRGPADLVLTAQF